MANTLARGVQRAQVFLGRVAVEGHAVRDPELLRERLELGALVAAADDVEGHVEGGVELRQGREHDVDVLLGGEAADEQDAVRVARREVGA